MITREVLLEMAKCIMLAEQKHGSLTRSEKRGFLCFAFPDFVPNSEYAGYVMLQLDRYHLI